MKKIRVKLVFEDTSRGRGVGVYGEMLMREFEKSEEVELVERRPDLVHFTYYKFFNLDLPVIYKHKTVITIHDLTPLVLPQLYPLGFRGRAGLIYQRMRARAAHAIITDSVNSKQDIERIFGIDDHKLFVAPLASRAMFYKSIDRKTIQDVGRRYRLPKQFILTVAGGPNPNKNLVRLAQACQRINQQLVIVGKGVGQDPSKVRPHPELRDFFVLTTMKQVIRLGYVSDEDLLCLYKLAAVYCQASLYEGFGLPLLEAMAAKAMVVASRTSSLPEIYHPATLSFDPYDIEQMSETLKRAMEMTSADKQKIIDKNYRQSLGFGFDRMAQATLSAYKYCFLR